MSTVAIPPAVRPNRAPSVDLPPWPVRARQAASALGDLLEDPNRLDRVLALCEAVNAKVLPDIWGRFQADETGRAILEEKPALDRTTLDFAALRALPEGTLGREYVRFLDDNGITPDVFKRPDLANAEVAYLAQRIRQTHDLWHVLTGYSPDVPGEILLQWFTYAQTRAPSAFLIGLFGTLRFGIFERGFLPRVVHAYRKGGACRFLATVRWESRWNDRVEDLRREFDCTNVASG
ncbi:MAG: Coq4 family protein [Polyangiaceae bacterium]